MVVVPCLDVSSRFGSLGVPSLTWLYPAVIRNRDDEIGPWRDLAAYDVVHVEMLHKVFR